MPIYEIFGLARAINLCIDYIKDSSLCPEWQMCVMRVSLINETERCLSLACQDDILRKLIGVILKSMDDPYFTIPIAQALAASEHDPDY